MTTDLIFLLVLALPVASIAWTVTKEEVFREPREYFIDRSKNARSILVRKLSYLFTCEYCFSHYVVIGVIAVTDYHLLYTDWRGYVVAGFALVWIANVYMNLFARVRIDIKAERLEATLKEEQLKATSSEPSVVMGTAAPASTASSDVLNRK